MKKGFVWAGVLAVSMVASGVTAYTVTKAADKDSYTPAESFASNVGTHFTAYEEGGYPDLTYAAENAVKGVVNIVNTQEISSRAGYRGGYGDDGGFEQFFDLFGIPRGQYRQQPEQQPRPQERKSGGSGVIISPDGYIVTNHHVVDNASKLKVTLNDKRTFDAKVIGTDPTTEVALIKIDANDLPTIPIGNSDALRLGEWVLAIGSPYGLQNTITAGIVSAKGRSLQALPTQYSLESFIQTDAAVNPGNSGGPALMGDKVIGVAFQGLNNANNTGYVIPTPVIRHFLEDIKDGVYDGYVDMGIQAAPILNPAMRKAFGLPDDVKGVLIGKVLKGSSADGVLRNGDLLMKVDGYDVDSSAMIELDGQKISMKELIERCFKDDRLPLDIIRDGKPMKVEMVMKPSLWRNTTRCPAISSSAAWCSSPSSAMCLRRRTSPCWTSPWISGITRKTAAVWTMKTW